MLDPPTHPGYEAVGLWGPFQSSLAEEHDPRASVADDYQTVQNEGQMPQICLSLTIVGLSEQRAVITTRSYR